MPFCRHCGHQYEGAAKFCPECGQPQTDVAAAQAQAPQEPPISQDEPEEVIWEGESKSMANRMSGGKVVSARYRLTNRAIYFREGVVAKTTEQVPLWAVRDIDISEGMLQRRRGVGTLKVFVEHSDYTGKTPLSWMMSKNLAGSHSLSTSKRSASDWRTSSASRLNTRGKAVSLSLISKEAGRARAR